MYELIKTAISAGGYKLAEMQNKIKRFYLLGDLTEAQMDELLALTVGGVSADAERPETLAILRTLATEIESLKTRVATLEGVTDNPETDIPAESEYPAWKPWDGISDDYQLGAIVAHKDKVWESTFAGQNVWEPGAPGTDAMWREYVG